MNLYYFEYYGTDGDPELRTLTIAAYESCLAFSAFYEHTRDMNGSVPEIHDFDMDCPGNRSRADIVVND